MARRAPTPSAQWGDVAESLPASVVDDEFPALPAPAPTGFARLRRLPHRMYDLIQKVVSGTIAGKIIAPYILIQIGRAHV